MQDLILDPYLRNALLDWLMDGTLLWATASSLRHESRRFRIIGAAAIGGLYNFWLGLARDGFLPGNWLSHPLIFLGLVPILLLTVAFAPFRWSVLAKLGGVFYLFALVSWGLAGAVRQYLILRGTDISPWLSVCLQIGFALGLAELGWGAVHRQAVARVCQVPLSCELGETHLETQGYLDTGNHLHDPTTRRPVVVMDYALVRPLLTPAARAFVEAMADGGGIPNLPAEDPWLPRLRAIPYRSIQSQPGLMPGLRADSLRLGTGTRSVCHRSIVIGLELTGGLGKEDCRALVPPALWSWNLNQTPHRGKV